MGAQSEAARPGFDLTSYIDLLGHDVLNSNQAVLSYLELIISSPGMDPRTKKYAQKAASHIRACAVLIDNVKRMTAARRGDLVTGGGLDLTKAMRVAADKVTQILPDRRVEFRFHPSHDETIVLGGGIVPDVLLNLLINIIQLDQGDDVILKVEVTPVREHGVACWRLAISDERLPLNQALAEGISGEGWTQDRSRIVKMTGLVFAKLMAENIGGSLTLGQCSGGKGSTYVLMLKGGESE